VGAFVKLHLGVIDIPYRAAGAIKSRRKNKPVWNAGAMTTGAVARILEDKYAVMGNFAALHIQDIAESFAIGISESIESLMQGAPASVNPFGQATSETEQMFKTYLTNSEIRQTGQAGIPTEAAQKGVSHRLKSKKGSPRPDFIDTGLYQSSFKAWTE
jgi:hypothetical protein